MNKDDDYPHLRNLTKRNKENSLNPVPRKQSEPENHKQPSRSKLIISYHLGTTPVAIESNHNNKNFIQENKNKVINKEIPKKSTKKEDLDTAIHKNYGKTPEYLQKYKQDAEDKKEML